MKILLDLIRRLPNVHTLHEKITAIYELWLSFYSLVSKLAAPATIAEPTFVVDVPEYSAPVPTPPATPVPTEPNAERSGALVESALAQSPGAVVL